MENPKRPESKFDARRRLSLLENIRETCEKSMDESLTRDSISNTLSDNVQQAKEMQQRVPLEPNTLVARYYSDHTLYKGRRKHRKRTEDMAHHALHRFKVLSLICLHVYPMETCM